MKYAHILSPVTFNTLCGKDDGAEFVYGGIDDAYRAVLCGIPNNIPCPNCCAMVSFSFTRKSLVAEKID